MKFLKKEEIAVVLAFMAIVFIICAIFYFAKESVPKVEAPQNNCEVECPVPTPCHSECNKEEK